MFGSLGFIEYKEKPGWGNVVFYYDLLGETLTGNELYNAVENAAFVADKWDDYIVQNFGGETTQMSLDKQKKSGEQQGGEGQENWEE